MSFPPPACIQSGESTLSGSVNRSKERVDVRAQKIIEALLEKIQTHSPLLLKILSLFIEGMDRKTENRFYDLLGLQLSGEITSRQREELTALLEKHPAFKLIFDELVNAHAPQSYDREVIEQAYASHYISKKFLPELQSVEKKVSVTSARNVRIGWRRAVLAAVAMVVLAIGAYLFNAPVKNKPYTTNEMATPKGSKSKVVLEDGTVVLLNADSRLEYRSDFNGETREVMLTGEAYFDVIHNPAKPFIIHTENADIKVLGTVFNVKSYPQDAFLETSLISGKIEVTLRNAANKKIILEPSEKLVASKRNFTGDEKNSKDLLTITGITLQDSIVAETSWTEDRIVWVKKPLHEIANELERLYNMKVVFLSDTAKDYTYTVNIENTGAADVLEILSLSRKIDYTLTKGNELIIK